MTLYRKKNHRKRGKPLGARRLALLVLVGAGGLAALSVQALGGGPGVATQQAAMARVRALEFDWSAVVRPAAASPPNTHAAGAAGWVRVEVPVPALVRLQSEHAQDLRVLAADGTVLPHAVVLGQGPAPEVDLGAGAPEGAFARVWTLPFATPVRALRVQLLDAPAQVPLRVAGRSEAAQAWQPLALLQAFSRPHAGQVQRNAALALPPKRYAQLRINTDNGTTLSEYRMAAMAELVPVQLFFQARGPGPFQVLAGRADTPAAAQPLEQWVTPGAQEARFAQWSALPAAPLQQRWARTPGAGLPWWTAWLPDALLDAWAQKLWW